jgi:hypothetical protein
MNGRLDRFQVLINYESGDYKVWDTYFDVAIYSINGLTLYPKNNKVINIGFDNSGTYCKFLKFPQSIDNNNHTAKFTNIFVVNRYALYCFSKLQDKYLTRFLFLKNTVKFILIKIFGIDKNRLTKFMKKLSKFLGFWI